MNDTYTVILVLIAIVAAAAYVRLWRKYRRNIEKVKFMFDAIDNIDYSFNFATEGVTGADRLMNMSLNRIKRILQRARDEALEREKYYEQIINAADTGILVVNEKGNILQHNRAAEKLLDNKVLTHLDQIRNQLWKSGLSVHETEARLKGKKVSIFTVSDIDKELANREVDSWVKLIRVLTHEIMNTVTPITSLSATLLKNARGEQHDGLETINKTGRELIAFVENYRKFTHVPTPKPDLFYFKPFAERMASLTGRRIDISVEPDDMMIYADEGLIAHVMTNVLKNAVQATSPSAPISIRAFINDMDNTVVDITNVGEPIPDDVAQHIFVPFFTTKKEGSGIGLSLSRQIMRMSDGSISLKQNKEKREVTFELVFK